MKRPKAWLAALLFVFAGCSVFVGLQSPKASVAGPTDTTQAYCSTLGDIYPGAHVASTPMNAELTNAANCSIPYGDLFTLGPLRTATFSYSGSSFSFTIPANIWADGGKRNYTAALPFTIAASTTEYFYVEWGQNAIASNTSGTPPANSTLEYTVTSNGSGVTSVLYGPTATGTPTYAALVILGNLTAGSLTDTGISPGLCVTTTTGGAFVGTTCGGTASPSPLPSIVASTAPGAVPFVTATMNSSGQYQVTNSYITPTPAPTPTPVVFPSIIASTAPGATPCAAVTTGPSGQYEVVNQCPSPTPFVTPTPVPSPTTSASPGAQPCGYFNGFTLVWDCAFQTPNPVASDSAITVSPSPPTWTIGLNSTQPDNMTWNGTQQYNAAATFENFMNLTYNPSAGCDGGATGAPTSPFCILTTATVGLAIGPQTGSWSSGSSTSSAELTLSAWNGTSLKTNTIVGTSAGVLDINSAGSSIAFNNSGIFAGYVEGIPSSGTNKTPVLPVYGTNAGAAVNTNLHASPFTCTFGTSTQTCTPSTAWSGGAVFTAGSDILWCSVFWTGSSTPTASLVTYNPTATNISIWASAAQTSTAVAGVCVGY